MDLITIDFETYYDRDYSLSKMTTEEYVRDPRFEVIGVGIKLNNNDAEWASGSHEHIKEWLMQYDWANSMVLAHNTMFDGAILGWHFDIIPRLWLDTLCMGRAVHGVEVSGTLASLVEREGLGEKGTEVANAKGMQRAHFTPEQLSRYGDYCLNDVELTYKLFYRLAQKFPKAELRIIDLTLRMFIEPKLWLAEDLLTQHLAEIVEKKDKLLAECGVAKDDLMSNPKFAQALLNLGVTPPMKTSPLTGKQTYAFAKNDEAFIKLVEHPDWRVQALVTGRLGLKSTLEETRTQRFLDIASRGPLPVPIKYYAAHTGRFGGDDKINMQNLPSRGAAANKLKKAIMPPPGYSIIDCDSSQIEARVLAWLAGQEDLISAFAVKEDVYKKMASTIYGVREKDVTKEQRFVGKTTILGAGYGMGAVKFQAQLKAMGVTMDLDEARRVIEIYRQANSDITNLWRQAQNMLVCMTREEPSAMGRPGVLTVLHEQRAIQLPNTLKILYEDLMVHDTEKGVEFTYKIRRGRARIYGGKVIENVCQALARCVIAEQMLMIAKKYKVVLTVHDAVACICRDHEVEEAQAYVEECMRWAPEWAQGLPLNCESGVGKSYGDC